MNTKLLIDAIVRQTTVLIAQLSTAAGVRAPLAQLADQVFLSLSREIEAQGVARKVVADMFGMALRGYQKKTQRIAESNSQQGKTLFEAVLEHIETSGGTTRQSLLRRFQYDGERETVGVLTDLVSSGLLYSTGSGGGTLYGLTSEAERQRLTRDSDLGSLAGMAWGLIYRSPGLSAANIESTLRVDAPRVHEALQLLLAEGRVQQAPAGGYIAPGFQISSGTEHGWEAAVFDHFQAVASAIANKLTLLGTTGPAQQWIGGTTLRFELASDHPHKAEVLGLLREVRMQLNQVWDKVSEYNDTHPIPDEQRFNLVFYFGQDIDSEELARCETTHIQQAQSV